MEQTQTIDPGKALAAYDPRQYQVVVKPEDLVPLSPLVRIDLTAVPLGECAAIGGGKVMPSREVTDQIGSAAGVTFIESGCSVEKLDATTWVGRATAERMMRDGSRERRVAEYEWDAQLRARGDGQVFERGRSTRVGAAAEPEVWQAAGGHRGEVARDPVADRDTDRFQAGRGQAAARAVRGRASTSRSRWRTR